MLLLVIVQEGIGSAFDKAYSEGFQNIVNNTKNPYGNGGASKAVVDIIKNFDLNEILKKTFYDL